MIKFVHDVAKKLSRVFCEELVRHYPATLFSNQLCTPESRTGLAAQDLLLLNALRNAHLGKRCFIVCNGPSLTVADLEKLRFEYTFASNKIYLLFDQTPWRPSFYSCEDTLVLQQNEQDIMGLDRTLKIFPNHVLDFVDRHKGCYYVDFINHVELLSDPPNQAREFSLDLTQGIHWGSTITYTLMQMAVFMGFKEINLIGLDHKYSLPQKKDGHFYISEGEQNHFSPDYRKVGEKWHEPRLEVLERSYEYARQACEEVGVSVYNVSRETALDVIEKRSFEDSL